MRLADCQYCLCAAQRRLEDLYQYAMPVKAAERKGAGRDKRSVDKLAGGCYQDAILEYLVASQGSDFVSYFIYFAFHQILYCPFVYDGNYYCNVCEPIVNTCTIYSRYICPSGKPKELFISFTFLPHFI